MSFKVKVLQHSKYTSFVQKDIKDLLTLEVTMPRIILSEMNTHRVLSKNSASSRAIPVEKMIKMVEDDPYIPTHWGKNQKGMQAEIEVSDELKCQSECEWLLARDNAIRSAKKLLDIGIHKQITNRLLEPFMWHTVIISGTEWDNFFNLRDNKDAHPEIQKIAKLMKDAISSSTPKIFNNFEIEQWHMPLVYEEDINEVKDIQKLIKISVGRCARVSYLTHNGKRDHQADIELHDRLLESGHMSPFEHVARPLNTWELMIGSHEKLCGNFKDWVQYRKLIPNESNRLSSK